MAYGVGNTKAKELLKLARKANRILVNFPGNGGSGVLNIVKKDYIEQLKHMVILDKEAYLEGEYELHPNGNLYL